MPTFLGDRKDILKRLTKKAEWKLSILEAQFNNRNRESPPEESLRKGRGVWNIESPCPYKMYERKNKDLVAVVIEHSQNSMYRTEYLRSTATHKLPLLTSYPCSRQGTPDL